MAGAAAVSVKASVGTVSPFSNAARAWWTAASSVTNSSLVMVVVDAWEATISAAISSRVAIFFPPWE
jgi:hypothetical protein